MANLHDKTTWLLPRPLGVSLFSFSQNVWEMTTVVDEIACHSCNSWTAWVWGCRGTMFTLAHPQSLITTYRKHSRPRNYTRIHKPKSSQVQQERLEQASCCLKTTCKYFSCNIPSGPWKLQCPIITQVCDLCQLSSWTVSCCTVHSDDKPVLSGNHCTYIDIKISIK